MCDTVKKILSRDSGPFWQFVKYGVIGVMSTLVQMAVFYVLAATCLKCLKSDDFAVRLFSLPPAEITDGARALRFSIATGIGFIVANVFCWLMNRRFVFTPGRFPWHTELAMFFSASGAAMLLALGLSAALINWCALMTTLAVFAEIAVSFAVNYAIRKFFIFKG